MTHKFNFEALNRTLCDILSEKDPYYKDIPFRGITIILGGDFRQILLVIHKRKRSNIV